MEGEPQSIECPVTRPLQGKCHCPRRSKKSTDSFDPTFDILPEFHSTKHYEEGKITEAEADLTAAEGSSQKILNLTMIETKEDVQHSEDSSNKQPSEKSQTQKEESTKEAPMESAQEQEENQVKKDLPKEKMNDDSGAADVNNATDDTVATLPKETPVKINPRKIFSDNIKTIERKKREEGRIHSAIFNTQRRDFLMVRDFESKGERSLEARPSDNQKKLENYFHRSAEFYAQKRDTKDTISKPGDFFVRPPPQPQPKTTPNEDEELQSASQALKRAHETLQESLKTKTRSKQLLEPDKTWHYFKKIGLMNDEEASRIQHSINNPGGSMIGTPPRGDMTDSRALFTPANHGEESAAGNTFFANTINTYDSFDFEPEVSVIEKTGQLEALPSARKYDYDNKKNLTKQREHKHKYKSNQSTQAYIPTSGTCCKKSHMNDKAIDTRITLSNWYLPVQRLIDACVLRKMAKCHAYQTNECKLKQLEDYILYGTPTHFLTVEKNGNNCNNVSYTENGQKIFYDTSTYRYDSD